MSIDNLFDSYFNGIPLWGKEFWKRIDNLGKEASDLLKQGYLEQAEARRIDEIRLLEYVLHQGRGVLDDKHITIAVIYCGEAYSSLANIYYKTNRDDTLPLLLSYVRLLSGINWGLTVGIEQGEDSLLDHAIESFDHVTHILSDREWDANSLPIESFPTIYDNTDAKFFYANVLYNLSKEDILSSRDKYIANKEN